MYTEVYRTETHNIEIKCNWWESPLQQSNRTLLDFQHDISVFFVTPFAAILLFRQYNMENLLEVFFFCWWYIYIEDVTRKRNSASFFVWIFVLFFGSL